MTQPHLTSMPSATSDHRLPNGRLLLAIALALAVCVALAAPAVALDPDGRLIDGEPVGNGDGAPVDEDPLADPPATGAPLPSVMPVAPRPPENLMHRFRYPQLSPDGSKIVFTCQEDLFVVDRGGGDARRLTTHVAREILPVWSTDGDRIFFSAARHGGYDLYSIPADGGAAMRLTYGGTGVYPSSVSPDGQWVYCYSYIDNSYDLVKVSTQGGPVIRLTNTYWDHEWGLVQAPRGDMVAYVSNASAGEWTRPDYIGSANCEIRTARITPDGLTEHSVVTNNQTHDMWPHFVLMPSALWLMYTAYAPPPQGTPYERQQGYVPGDPNMRQYFPRGLYAVDPTQIPIVDPLDQSVDLQTASPSCWPIHAFLDDERREPSQQRPLRRAHFQRIGPTAIYSVAEMTNGGIYFIEFRASGRSRPEMVRSEALQITINDDPKFDEVESITTTSDASEYALSPDGNKLAFVVEGEVYVMAADGGASRRITNTYAREYQVAWSADSLSLVYTSLRNGNLDLFVYHLPEATEEPFAADPSVDESNALWSPKNEIAYLVDDAAIWVADAPAMTAGEEAPPQEETGEGEGENGNGESDGDGEGDADTDAAAAGPRLFIEATFYFSRRWSSVPFTFSPDGEWLACSPQNPTTWESEIFVGRTDGGVAPTMITEFGHGVRDYRFTHDGKAMLVSAWMGEDYDTYYLPFERSAETFSEDELDELFTRPTEDEDEAEDESESASIDFDGLWDRRVAVTTMSTNEHTLMLTPDGNTYIFLADILNGTHFWTLSARPDGSSGGSLNELGSRSGGKGAPQMSNDGKYLYFLNGGRIARITLRNGSTSTVSHRASYRVDRQEQRLAVFDEAIWVFETYYYDPEHHGLDLDAAAAYWRRQVPLCGTDREFRTILNELVDGLNSSHMGAYDRPGASPSTSSNRGYLGVRFATEPMSRGLYTVNHVIPDTPATAAEVDLRVGDTLLAINGVPLHSNSNLDELLQDTIGARITLTVTDAAITIGPDGSLAMPEGAGTREFDIAPTDSRSIRNALYVAWTRANEARVEAETNGRFGYFHIRSMNNSSLSELIHALRSRLADKEGLVLDVRGNGGGSTAVKVLAILKREPWMMRTITGREALTENFYRDEAWEKPAVLLTDNRSFSNAEILSEGFRRLRVGPVIGVPTPGGVIGTSSHTLVDGSRVRLPVVGAFTVEFENLENKGRPVDVYIDDTANDQAAGRTPMLDAAVRELTKQWLYYSETERRPYDVQPRAQIEPDLEARLQAWLAAGGFDGEGDNGGDDNGGDGE